MVIKGISYLDFVNQKYAGQNQFILRHDVDKKPANSLRIAQMQAELGMLGTYYFRIVPESYQTEVY